MLEVKSKHNDTATKFAVSLHDGSKGPGFKPCAH